MIAPDMINDFDSLSKTRVIATIQLTLESHISVNRFQMTLGILDVGIAKVTSILVFSVEKVPFRPVMSLGILTLVIPFIALFTKSARWRVEKSKNVFFLLFLRILFSNWRRW
jgi:hypothetical protein